MVGVKRIVALVGVIGVSVPVLAQGGGASVLPPLSAPRITTVAGSLGAGRPIDTGLPDGLSWPWNNHGLATDGHVLYVGDVTTIRMYDPATGSQRVVIGDGSDIESLPTGGPATGGGASLRGFAVAPDGRLDFATQQPYTSKFSLRRYDPATGQETLLKNGYSGGIQAVDGAGGVLYSVVNSCTVTRYDPTSDTTSTAAGTTCFDPGFVTTPAGATAATAKFGPIQSIGVLPSGDLALGDGTFGTVWDVPASGAITALAPLHSVFPSALSVDPSGNVFTLGPPGVVRLQVGGSPVAVAGGGTQVGVDGIPATQASLHLATTFGNSYNIIAATAGGLYLDDDVTQGREIPHRVRFVGGDGLISTVFGITSPPPGDGGPALASQIFPSGLVAHNGVIDVLQGTATGYEIRRIARGTISAFTTIPPAVTSAPVADGAGDLFLSNGSAIIEVKRDGSTTTAVSGVAPQAVSLDGNGNLYYTVFAPATLPLITTFDELHLIRHNLRTGAETLMYSYGTVLSQVRPSRYLSSIAATPGGSVYLFNDCQVVDVVQPNVAVPVTFPQCGNSGDGGPAAAAMVSPEELGTDAFGDVFLLDTVDGNLRMINQAGLITTVAGTSQPGFGSDGPAAAIGLDNPRDLTVAPDGTAYLFEQYRVRKVTPS